MQGKLLTLICALALARGVLSNVDPFSACIRACSACKCLSIEPPTTCSATEAEGILLPHEHCNKFYICSHGAKVTFDCYGDLLFNPLTGQCDYTYNVICDERVIPDKEDKPEETDGVESNDNDAENEGVAKEVEDDNDNLDNGDENSNNINSNPGGAPLICSASNSNDILVAHEVCNNFYICDNGVPTTMKCPKGLLYNPYTERCDWPYEVECGDRVIVDEESSNEDSENGNISNENGGDNDNTVGACNCDPAEAPSICSNEGSSGILVAHEVCRKFYICDHGVPVTKRCPFGLLYNPKTERCDWPRNVRCGDRVVVEEDAEEDIGEEVGEKADEEVGEEVGEEAGEEVGEEAGEEVGEEVDEEAENENEGNENENDNSNSDGEEDNNDNDEPVEPQPESDLFEIAKAICADNESDGRMSAHHNCHQFYVCLNYEPALLSCPLGLYFNSEKHTCEWPQSVQCDSRIFIEN